MVLVLLALGSLSALTETLTLSTGGDVAYPALNQVGDVMITATSTITGLDFSSVATGGTIMTGAGVLNIANLTGDVNLGRTWFTCNCNSKQY